MYPKYTHIYTIYDSGFLNGNDSQYSIIILFRKSPPISNSKALSAV